MRLRHALSIGPVAVACVALAGCAAATVPVGATEVASCIDGPFRAELHVDARDLRRVWATSADTGRVVAVRPRPPGRFAFDPTRPTVMLDAAGNVLSFSGEITRTGCFDAASGVLLIGPGDVPDPGRPPN